MKAILLISLLIFTKLAIAEDTGYEVEVIIFEDATELYKNSENWPIAINSNKTAVKAISELDQNPTEQKPDYTEKKSIFEFLSSEKNRLNDQAQKLEESRNYNVLYHKAWKQLGLDKDAAISITIDTRNTNNTEPNNISEAESKSFIKGEFTLIMSRYLHVISNLILYKPTIQTTDTLIESYKEINNESTISKNLQVDTNYEQYPLIFERRMRSKEIHYIDHPMGGMIVLATPFKIEADKIKQSEGYKTF